MYRLHRAEAAVLFFGLVLAPAHAGQQETCTMDDSTHVAKYSCPDG